MVTWGNSPQWALPITDTVPDSADEPDESLRAAAEVVKGRSAKVRMLDMPGSGLVKNRQKMKDSIRSSRMPVWNG